HRDVMKHKDKDNDKSTIYYAYPRRLIASSDTVRPRAAPGRRALDPPLCVASGAGCRASRVWHELRGELNVRRGEDRVAGPARCRGSAASAYDARNWMLRLP